jgi:hypothetical protein
MRTSVPAALAAFALSLATALTGAAPAQAAAVFLEANPDTVRAGDQVGLRASCTDNLVDAVVVGGPIGRVVVRPNVAFLTATVRVPPATEPGDYRLTLTCTDRSTASTVLHVVARVEPTRGPATGGGGTAPGGSAPLMIGGGLTAIAAGLVLALISVRRRRLG